MPDESRLEQAAIAGERAWKAALNWAGDPEAGYRAAWMSVARAVQGVLDEVTDEQVERACQAFERVTVEPYGIEVLVRAVLAAAREGEQP